MTLAGTTRPIARSSSCFQNKRLRGSCDEKPAFSKAAEVLISDLQRVSCLKNHSGHVMEVASACGVRSGEELRQTQVKLQMGGEGGRSV